MLQAEYPIWNAPSLMPHLEYPQREFIPKAPPGIPHRECIRNTPREMPHPECIWNGPSGMPCLECFTLNAVNIQMQTYAIQFLGVQP